MRSYELKLNGKKCKLRLTAGMQKALLKEKEKSFFEILFECMTDSLNCIDVFDKALDFKGNENEIQSGEELYDEMVNAGFEGTERFFDVVLSVAQTSGIINEDQRKKIKRASESINKGMYDKMTDLDKFFEEDDLEKEAEQDEAEQESAVPKVGDRNERD